MEKSNNCCNTKQRVLLHEFLQKILRESQKLIHLLERNTKSVESLLYVGWARFQKNFNFAMLLLKNQLQTKHWHNCKECVKMSSSDAKNAEEKEISSNWSYSRRNENTKNVSSNHTMDVMWCKSSVVSTNIWMKWKRLQETQCPGVNVIDGNSTWIYNCLLT